IALTMRLDEQPGETSARRGSSQGGNHQEQRNGRNGNGRNRQQTSRSSGSASITNSVMSDALAAAFGKKR
ncbi:hypothetical protein KKJ22_20665, partial [Xenorhabdus bovienii]